MGGSKFICYAHVCLPLFMILQVVVFSPCMLCWLKAVEQGFASETSTAKSTVCACKIEFLKLVAGVNVLVTNCGVLLSVSVWPTSCFF